MKEALQKKGLFCEENAFEKSTNVQYVLEIFVDRQTDRKTKYCIEAPGA